MAAAEAGVMMVSSFVGISGSALSAIGAWAAANPILAGALVGGIYSGAQVAINGGSFSQILKAAAIEAVTGAVGAVLGAFLHGFGEAIGGELAGAGLGKAGGEVAGKVVHAAAHGVVGGATSMAMGGTFQDGFIGSAIGAGVSSAMGAIPGLDVLEGPGVVKVIGRTAVASISGGVASVLAGGKFADGAYSAAFFHLFNDETHRAANWEYNETKVEELSNYAKCVQHLVSGGALTVLEGGAQVVEYEISMLRQSGHPLDLDISATFVKEITSVMGSISNSKFYVDFGTTNTGFNKGLIDQSNQLRHFFANVELGYRSGVGVGVAAVGSHIREFITSGSNTSPQDYRLNNIGLRAGASINGGSLWQFGHYMRKVLK